MSEEEESDTSLSHLERNHSWQPFPRTQKHVFFWGDVLPVAVFGEHRLSKVIFSLS